MIKTSNSVTSRLFPGCEQRERHLLGGRPVWFRQLITRLTEHLKDLDQRVDEFETQIKAWHRSSELSMKLEKIPGIGPLGASFDNGRQLSAWLGLVPRQHSSGGKPTAVGHQQTR